MLYPPFNLTARSLWLKCAPADDGSAQKNFWADIVLYIKANPGKSIFFDDLIKKICLQDEKQEYIKLPLSLLVDSLIRAETIFDEELWAAIIKEWAKIKIDLKIKTQTVILQKENLIKKFLLAVLGKSKNPKPVIRQIAKESGLLKNYSKNDVIMMLCSIVADSLNYQMQTKGIEFMEGIFQMDEDMLEKKEEKTDAKEIIDEKPAKCSFVTQGKNKELQVLWDIFLSELAQMDSLDECWVDTQIYINEIQDIADKKIQERNEIIKRRNLISAFSDKASYIDDVFRVQLNELDINIPPASIADSFDNVYLERLVEILTSIQQILQRYKELSSAKKSSLIEEKKRIGQLFTVMTDIENFVAQLSEVTTNAASFEQSEEVVLQAEPVVETVNEVAEPYINESDSLNDVQADKNEDQEEQIELFMGK